eukprot:TRINITY_DN50445_c0_g1_i1.p1 TRINITY_DN50445_c0_g1~~TRINITY_DN50445_c0_g1_i1.p1  ORF type:complete len:355 (-),score=53.11 TRINITY_DN50445_c0_g1_i1:44-1108(-)
MQSREERSRSPRRPAARKLAAAVDAKLEFEALKGGFGGLLKTQMSVDMLLANSGSLGVELAQAWQDFGGLLVLRGLNGISPSQFVELSGFFGEVESQLDDSKKKYQVLGNPAVMRIGNTRNPMTSEMTSLFANDRPLPEDGSPQYCIETRTPSWHTDSTYRAKPPVGSLLFCKQAPPEGAATCFADMRAAYLALDSQTRARLDGLECICSQAHHDAKVHLRSPDFPVLTPEERAASPPTRVPMVLRHPLTGVPALYGMNGSTCAVVPKGVEISQERMDQFELEVVEDPSVHKEWRSLLPFVTSEKFAIKWQWQPGDVVIWDNRCTIHCATGFDHDRYEREMWRTTLEADRSSDN